MTRLSDVYSVKLTSLISISSSFSGLGFFSIISDFSKCAIVSGWTSNSKCESLTYASGPYNKHNFGVEKERMLGRSGLSTWNARLSVVPL